MGLKELLLGKEAIVEPDPAEPDPAEFYPTLPRARLNKTRSALLCSREGCGGELAYFFLDLKRMRKPIRKGDMAGHLEHLKQILRVGFPAWQSLGPDGIWRENGYDRDARQIVERGGRPRNKKLFPRGQPLTRKGPEPGKPWVKPIRSAAKGDGQSRRVRCRDCQLVNVVEAK